MADVKRRSLTIKYHLHLTVTQVCAPLPDHLHDPRDRFRTASVGKDRRELFRDLDLAADGWLPIQWIEDGSLAGKIATHTHTV